MLVPWDQVLESDSLSPAQKYQLLRRQYPTFADSTIRFAIHEHHSTDLPFAHLDTLIDDAQRMGRVPASVAQSLSTKEQHYFAKYFVWTYGFEDVTPLEQISENASCDRGTLLFLYWWAIHYRENPIVDELDGDELALELIATRARLTPVCDWLAEKLRSRLPRSETMAYDPASEHSPAILASGHPELITPSRGEPFGEF
jgi:hypothetical protein